VSSLLGEKSYDLCDITFCLLSVGNVSASNDPFTCISQEASIQMLINTAVQNVLNWLYL